MNQSHPELLAPHKAALVAAGRAGDPPNPPLTWDKPGAGPRSCTIVLCADSGVVGKLGCKFEKVSKELERIDVIEAEPVLCQLGELQRENAELRERLAAAGQQAGAEAPAGDELLEEMIEDGYTAMVEHSDAWRSDPEASPASGRESFAVGLHAALRLAAPVSAAPAAPTAEQASAQEGGDE